MTVTRPGILATGALLYRMVAYPHHFCFARWRLEVVETLRWPRRIATLVVALARPFGRREVLAKVVEAQTSPSKAGLSLGHEVAAQQQEWIPSLV